MDAGGGAQITKDILAFLRKDYFCEAFNYELPTIDFDTLLLIGCTYLNPEIMEYYKARGVKIVLYPIYDRMKPLWQLRALKPLIKAPFLNIYNLRKKIFDASDIILVANESERRDIVDIYNCDPKKVNMMHYCVNDKLIKLSDSVSPDLFGDKYPDFKDAIFCPAAGITKRKNQIKLLEAIEGTNYKLILNNTNNIEPDIKDRFEELTVGNPNVLCLGRISLEEMISCYKSSHMSISVSQAETAGLVNLEAGYLGCNLIVSNLEALQEYVGKYATFVDQNDKKSILSAIEKSMATPKSNQMTQHVLDNYTWESYIAKLVALINKVEK